VERERGQLWYTAASALPPLVSPEIREVYASRETAVTIMVASDEEKQNLLRQVSLLKEQLEDEKQQRNADRGKEREGRIKERELREELEREIARLRKGHQASSSSSEAAERRADVLKRQLEAASKRADRAEAALYGSTSGGGGGGGGGMSASSQADGQRHEDDVLADELDAALREVAALRQVLKSGEQDARWQQQSEEVTLMRIAVLERCAPAEEREAVLRREVMMLRNMVDAMRAEAWAARKAGGGGGAGAGGGGGGGGAPRHNLELRVRRSFAEEAKWQRQQTDGGHYHAGSPVGSQLTVKSNFPVEPVRLKQHLPNELQRTRVGEGYPRDGGDDSAVASYTTLGFYATSCLAISLCFAYVATPPTAKDVLLSQVLIAISTFLVIFSTVAGFAFPLHLAAVTPNSSDIGGARESGNNTPRSVFSTRSSSPGPKLRTNTQDAGTSSGRGSTLSEGQASSDTGTGLRRLSAKERLEVLEREAYGTRP
jgi:hypothetical protein